ncbi:MAG: hypothetical protein HZC44_02895 [Geobacter sp.]|nr:hypothetical protein [Geobacter sp.]
MKMQISAMNVSATKKSSSASRSRRCWRSAIDNEKADDRQTDTDQGGGDGKYMYGDVYFNRARGMIF